MSNTKMRRVTSEKTPPLVRSSVPTASLSRPWRQGGRPAECRGQGLRHRLAPSASDDSTEALSLRPRVAWRLSLGSHRSALERRRRLTGQPGMEVWKVSQSQDGKPGRRLREKAQADFVVHLLGQPTYVSFSVRRAPLFMRFCLDDVPGKGNVVDVLDQLFDEPRDGEHLIAAVRCKSARVHVRRTGKRAEGNPWFWLVDYQPLRLSPAKIQTFRDTNAWRDWCLANEGRAKQLAEQATCLASSGLQE